MIVWLVLVALALSYVYVSSDLNVTGFTINKKTYNYSEDANIIFSNHTEFIWYPKKGGRLSSFMIQGSYAKGGSAKVYLDTGSERYLVFGSSADEESNLITGMAINDETEKDTYVNESQGTNSSLEDNSTTDAIDDETLLNDTVEEGDTNTSFEEEEEENQSISIILEYKENSPYDEDNDGIEELSGVVDFTVENSGFNFIPDKKGLCTLWTIIEKGSLDENTICYGGESCCSSHGMMPSRDDWDDVLELYYGAYGAKEDNVVEGKIFSENAVSEKASLDAMFINEETIQIKDACKETCLLPEIMSESYKIIIEAENTTLYIDKILYSMSEEVITNEAPIWNEEIKNITIKTNSSYILNLSRHFYDEDELYYSNYPADNITVKINEEIANLTPDKGFTGVRYMFFIANDTILSEVSNIFKVSVTEDDDDAINLVNISSKKESLNNTRVVINRPVRWVKKLKLKKPEKDIKVNITDKANNITVRKIENDTIKDITTQVFINYTWQEEDKDENDEPPSLITGMFTAVTGWVIQEEDKNFEEKNVTNILINETVEEVEIEYYTNGPLSKEKIISKDKKRIVISSDIHYNDILAYTYVDNIPIGSARMYWIVDGERLPVHIDEYDTDYDNLVDYIEWNVPHLSNQTYELELTILTVKSYPVVGGYWTVEFKTSGQSDLTIEAVEGTRFGEDIEFVELRCDDTVIDVSYDGTRVSYDDWLCSGTGYHKVQVLTSGPHTQMFTFGEETAYAYNDASNVPKTLNIQGKLTNATGDLVNMTANLTFRIYDAYTDGTKLWEENQTLFVDNGIYSAILGTHIDLNISFNDNRYLGISVNNDDEMTPRLNLTSSPYTYRAKVAENLTCTDCLGTIQIEDIYVSNTGDTIDGDLKVGGAFNATNEQGTILLDDSGNVKIGI